MRKLLSLSLALIGFSSAMASCALGGFEKVSSTSSSSGTGAGGSCDHAVAPIRPTSADPGGTLDLMFAMKTVDFGEDRALADRPGLDLDHACTCEEPMAAQCTLPPYTLMDARCDSANGRDNAVADLIAFVKMSTGSGSTQYTAAIAKGSWSILLEVSNYDGSPNDSKVSMALYMTPGLTTPPKWDGTDAWPLRGESFVGTTPAIIDNDAYVADGVLVGVFSGQIELNGGLKVKIGSGITMGKLTQNGAVWQLDDGLMAGSWNANDALAGLGNFLFSGLKVCDSPFYNGAHLAVCNRVDISSAPALPCDSLSFGMQFTGGQAKFGMQVPLEMPGTPCPVDKCE